MKTRRSINLIYVSALLVDINIDVFSLIISQISNVELTLLMLANKHLMQIIRTIFRARIINKSSIITRDLSQKIFDYLIEIDCACDPKLLLKFGRFDLYDKLLLPYDPKYTCAAAKYGRIDKLRMSEYELYFAGKNVYTDRYCINCNDWKQSRSCYENKRCVYPNDLINNKILYNQTAMIIHLHKLGYKPISCVEWALVNNIELFDYFMNKEDIKLNWYYSSNACEYVIEFGGPAAIDALIYHNIPLDEFIFYSALSNRFVILDYLYKIDPKEVTETIFMYDMFDAYKHLFSGDICLEHIDKLLRLNNDQETFNILRFILDNIQGSDKEIALDTIADYAAIHNEDSLVEIVLKYGIFTDISYILAIRYKSYYVLKYVGFRDHMWHYIIGANDAAMLDALNITPHYTTLMYAVRHNLENIVKWIVDRGQIFEKNHYFVATALGYDDIAKYYIDQ